MLSRELIESNLQPLGLKLPSNPPAPLGLYKPVRVDGDIAWTSALGPLAIDGTGFSHKGEIGTDLSEQDGRAAARVTALNLIAALDREPGLAAVLRILELVAYVRSAADFEGHPKVADGASEVILAAFGEEVGAHARTVVGVRSLPFALPFIASLRVRLGRGLS
jgi:enamine deaminase RidA (YjgF/YER057c/UK114 family)